MRCPVCDARLRAVEKHGVEVDICPDCKGVWLDRGELDKILEIAANESGGGRSGEGYPADRDRREREARPRSRDDEEYRYKGDRGGRRKTSSLLGDILGALGGGDD